VNGVQEPQEQNFTPFGVLQPGQWYEYEIQVQHDSYTVKLGNVRSGAEHDLPTGVLVHETTR
jgi:hypothetical protein